jgi:hypothetical protein
MQYRSAPSPSKYLWKCGTYCVIKLGTGIEFRTFVEQGTYLNQTKNPASVGPRRKDKIKKWNVELTELQTGKQFSSHIELLHPINFKEFNMIWTCPSNLTTL